MKRLIAIALLLTAGKSSTEIIETRDADPHGRWIVQHVTLEGRGKTKQDKAEAAFSKVDKWQMFDVDADGKKTKVKDKTAVAAGTPLVGAGEELTPTYYVEAFVSVAGSEDCVAAIEVTTQADVIAATNTIAEYLAPSNTVRVHQHNQWLPPHKNEPCKVCDPRTDETWKGWLP